MKLFVAVLLVAVAAAAPPRYSREYPEVIKYENNNIGVGPYSWGYEQTDGSKQYQRGEIKNEGLEDEYLYVEGAYEYIGDNGVRYIVKYVADKNGYQPEIEEGPGGVPPNIAATLLG